MISSLIKLVAVFAFFLEIEAFRSFPFQSKVIRLQMAESNTIKVSKITPEELTQRKVGA